MYTTATTWIADYEAVTAHLAADHSTATLDVAVDVLQASGAATPPPESCQLHAALFGCDGALLWEGVATPGAALQPGGKGGSGGEKSDAQADGPGAAHSSHGRPQPAEGYAAGTRGARALLRCTLLEPRLWSAETPALHTLALTLRDGATGDALACESVRVGVRTVRARLRSILPQAECMLAACACASQCSLCGCACGPWPRAQGAGAGLAPRFIRRAPASFQRAPDVRATLSSAACTRTHAQFLGSRRLGTARCRWRASGCA